MKHCPTCNKEFDDKQELCDKCNTKLEKKEDLTIKKIILPTIGLSLLILFIGTILLLITGAIIFFIPFSHTVTEPYTYSEPYTTTETYHEQEPYTTTETYYEQESYQEEECREETADYDYAWDGWGDGYYANFNVKFTNNEAQRLSFEVTAYFFDNHRYPISNSDNTDNKYASYKEEKTVTLNPYETKTVNFRSNMPTNTYSVWGRWDTPYVLIDKCEYVTKYRSVPKTKEVTKYRDTEKTRQVTKYREVTGTRNKTIQETLFQQWFGSDEEND